MKSGPRLAKDKKKNTVDLKAAFQACNVAVAEKATEDATADCVISLVVARLFNYIKNLYINS